jgi:anti-sigma regulatory factor (Ser/Thr protein kinase)
MQRQSSLNGSYGHGLLVHDSDEELVEGTRAFVEQGLACGGHVLVHGTTDRVAFLRGVLGEDRGLEYGFDEELYQAPTPTLFAYQRRLAEASAGSEFWVTGTVPLGRDSAEQAAWARYESLVNEALGAYPFRALCTYDSRTSPAAVIASARASHPTIGPDPAGHESPDYLDPADFLANPLAHLPALPATPPSLVAEVTTVDQLANARFLVKASARESSAVPMRAVEEFVTAVNEVAANGLVHGAPPVQVTLWADLTTLTCQVDDSGSCELDPMAGYRYPDGWGPMGLWVARQLVDELFVSNRSQGGCSVLLIKT